MILLITSSSRSQEFSTAIEDALGETVEVASTTKRALSVLRTSEFVALVLDEAIVECEPECVDALLHHSGMAVPVYVNLALSSAQRVVRDVKSAMRRSEEARLIAMRAAESLLRSEFRGAITGILLSTELAMRTPDLPPEAADKLRSVCQLASDIRNRMETVQ